MKSKFQKFLSFLTATTIAVVSLVLIGEISSIYAAKTFNLGTSGDTINIPGVVNLGSVSGSYSGTINSANVSSGAFGSNTGGGNYSFPGDLSFIGSLTGGTVPWARISGFTGDTTADTIADDGTITLGTETTGTYVASESDPTVAASVKDGVSWSELSGIPLGFSDNTDNDTTYSAGTGISIVETTISNTGVISESDPQVGSISTGYHPRWDGSALSTGSIYDNGSNIGIGTTTPNNLLQVAGLINFNNPNYSTLLGYQAGNSLFLNAGNAIGTTAIGYQSLYTATSSNYSTAVGYRALFSNTTGYRNSAMGYNALYSNTTGYQNSAMGYNALYSNTTGYNNLAMGYNALYSNTTGYQNSAMGFSPLYSNTTGSQNSAMGSSALGFNTTGSQNSAMGYQAGRYIADGSTGNAASTNSLYFGANTKALASGDTNEIVIGYDTTGLGSNTAVLGNSNITTTVLRGNVGIGTTAPVATLDVNGYARLAPKTSAPVTCSATYKGSIAYASVNNKLCICDGTSWVYDYNGAACGW